MAIIIKEIRVITTVEKSRKQEAEFPAEWLKKMRAVLREERYDGRSDEQRHSKNER